MSRRVGGNDAHPLEWKRQRLGGDLSQHRVVALACSQRTHSRPMASSIARFAPRNSTLAQQFSW